ncbi:MAG TPA: hypothetical protein VF792_01070 [Ktedonobacterales bacterium]
MVIRRSPHNLPGTDPLLIAYILGVIYLVLLFVILGLMMATVTLNAKRGGHLPWPLAQWAFTTPLGALAVAVAGGLVWGLPLALVVLTRPIGVYPVDVTELPPIWWPRPLPPWRVPGGGTLADYVLGHSRSQRVWSLLALIFSALFLIGLFAVFVAASLYPLRHIDNCSASGCPPSFSQLLTGAPEFIGITIMLFSQVARIAHVERRSGVWFRTREALEFRLGAYIRRPGVTREAAAVGLQRYTRSARRPLARDVVLIALAMTPAILLMIGGELLAAWLSTQWIPA